MNVAATRVPPAGDGRAGAPDDGAGDDTAAPTASRASPAGPPPGPTRADLRRLRWAWAAGAVPVVLVFAWLIMVGGWHPLQRQFFDDFYDHQARAFLDGRWDVPRRAVGFEGFVIGGKTYIYFGPGPALLRLPVLAITDRLDGRLTTLSMMLAMVVLAVAAHRLNVTMRTLVRGSAPVTRGELVATTGLAVAVLAGPPLWLASLAAVFHEAILWGLAFTVAALDAAGRWLMRPTRGRLVAVGALAAAAVMSRQTLGTGLLAGLALVGVLALADRLLAARRGWPVDLVPRLPLVGLVVVGVAVTLAMVVPNLAKFGQPLAPPIDRQIASMVFADRQAYLEANGGAYFRARFVPTTLLQYARPDAFDLRTDFPWIDFPSARPSVVGDVTFDRLEWTSSVPVTMPVLVLLAVPGTAWLVRAAWRRRPQGTAVLALWAGTFVSAGGALTIGYIGHRYIGDLVPIVLLPALVGAHCLLARQRRRHRAWSLVPVALGLLVVLGAWTNLALGIEYQRERGFNIPEEWRAQLMRWRADFPGGRRPVVRVAPDADELPNADDGTLAVVGECEGLYLRVGEDWRGVDRGPGAGVYDLRVDLDAVRELTPGERAPLVAFGQGADATIVAITRLSAGEMRVDFDDPLTNGWSEGDPVEARGEATIRVVIDPRAADRELRMGRVHLNLAPWADLAAGATVGSLPLGVDRSDVAARYPGAVSLAPFDRSLCRDATGIG